MDLEKIFANDATDRELIFKIYKQFIQLSIKNTQTNKEKILKQQNHKQAEDLNRYAPK